MNPPYITTKITWDKCHECGFYKLEYAIIYNEDRQEKTMHVCCHCCEGTEYCKPNW